MKKFLALLLSILTLIFIFYLITYLESLKRPKTPDALTNEADSSTLRYSSTSTEKLIIKVSGEKVLSSTDMKAKEKLLQRISKSSGVLLSDPDVIVEYVGSSDSLIAEVKNRDVDFSKQKAINYLKTSGFTENGICNLPIVFYLNHKIAQEYGKEKKEFSPIPDFCE